MDNNQSNNTGTTSSNTTSSIQTPAKSKSTFGTWMIVAAVLGLGIFGYMQINNMSNADATAPVLAAESVEVTNDMTETAVTEDFASEDEAETATADESDLVEVEMEEVETTETPVEVIETTPAPAETVKQ